MFLPAYCNAKVIQIKRVFPELWCQMYCHHFFGSQCRNRRTDGQADTNRANCSPTRYIPWQAIGILLLLILLLLLQPFYYPFMGRMSFLTPNQQRQSTEDQPEVKRSWSRWGSDFWWLRAVMEFWDTCLVKPWFSRSLSMFPSRHLYVLSWLCLKCSCRVMSHVLWLFLSVIDNCLFHVETATFIA